MKLQTLLFFLAWIATPLFAQDSAVKVEKELKTLLQKNSECRSDLECTYIRAKCCDSGRNRFAWPVGTKGKDLKEIQKLADNFCKLVQRKVTKTPGKVTPYTAALIDTCVDNGM